MKLSVLLRTTDFRGDHSADVAVAFEAEQGETVDHLAQRILVEGAKNDPMAWIEIRLVLEAELIERVQQALVR